MTRRLFLLLLPRCSIMRQLQHLPDASNAILFEACENFLGNGLKVVGSQSKDSGPCAGQADAEEAGVRLWRHRGEDIRKPGNLAELVN